MADLRNDWTLAMLRRSLGDVESRDEILAFLEQLMGERDELLKRQEHLHSLSLLAEMKVSDADELAGRIQKEAQSQAKNIVAKADDQARQVIEQTKAQALTEAQVEIRAIRSAAQGELEATLKEQTAKMRGKVKELADRFFDQMLIEAQESKRQMEMFRTDLEKDLASFGLAERLACEHEDQPTRSSKDS